MSGKLKVRIVDTVYHTTLELGRGKVRYNYRDEEDGHDAEDWQRAEEEISGKKSRYVA